MGKLIGEINTKNKSLNAIPQLSGELNNIVKFSGKIANSINFTDLYTGEYRFAPTTEEQIIAISGLKAKENIVIESIPSNYGLITWDGIVLTVS